MTSLGIVQKPTWLHQHSRYLWNLSFSLTDLSTHLTPFHQLQTCFGFLWLLPLLVVVYQIQPSNVVELQQHFPLDFSNQLRSWNDNFTAMFMKNGECVTMLSSVFWITQTKIVFLSHFVAEKYRFKECIRQFETHCIMMIICRLTFKYKYYAYFLDRTFNRRWIGRRGSATEFLPRSPDLTPVNFYLWGTLTLCCLN